MQYRESCFFCVNNRWFFAIIINVKTLGTVLTKTALRSLLLLYIALFLNFGPSYHHAPIFGLHTQAASSCACGCCSHRPTPKSENGLPVFSEPGCDCQLCKFFKFNNVQVTPKLDHFATDFSTKLCLQVVPQSTESEVFTRARGPPAA